MALIQPIVTVEPTYTRGRTNTCYWTSGTNPGELIEYLLERSSTSNFYTNDISTNEDLDVGDESRATSGTTLVYTLHSPKTVKGVFLESDSTKSTNYYTSGSGFVCNEIRLATPIPAGTGAAGGGVQVVVDYTRSGWTSSYFDTHYDLEDGAKYYYRVKSRVASQSTTSGTGYVYSTQDNKVDSLAILAPTGKETWFGNTTREVLWKAIDNTSGVSDNSNTIIYYSKDGGSTWGVLVSGTLIPNENWVYDEHQTSVDKHRVYTNYEIATSTDPRVYIGSSATGTDWYAHSLASGTNQYSGKEIFLDYPLPSGETTAVTINYKTYGKWLWNIPNTFDCNNMKLKVLVYDDVGNSLEKAMTDSFTIMTPIERLTDIFDKEATNINNLINTFDDSSSDLIDNVVATRNAIPYDGEYNETLTLQGKGYGLTRFDYEPDFEFRERIKFESRPANTKDATTNFLELYDDDSSGTNSLRIQNWMPRNTEDECFFIDYSFLDYQDRITSGTLLGEDPLSFDVRIKPKKYDTITYKKIANAITKTKPLSSLPSVRVIAGEAYGAFYYGDGTHYGSSEY